ncbi:MAG: hypothetical protein J6C33_02325 [Lachnospiraceae bacterium]|nr:hypothetical protein [Lachnospiraceae bacterium]
MEKQKYLEQIDKFYKGKLKSFQIIELGNTPDIIVNIGAKKLPLVMKQSNLRKCIREPRGSRSAHQIDREFIENLPAQIENPVLLTKDENRNSIVLISDYKDKNGFYTLIAVQREQIVNGKLVNEIKSIYGKEHLKEYLLKPEIRNELKIIDNKIAKELFRVIGLQLPKALTTLDYKTTIHKETAHVKPEKQKQAKKSEAAFKKSDIARDLRAHGFQPTKSLIENMRKLYVRSEGCRSLKDIHGLYQRMDALYDPETKELVERIADECRAQEMERLQIPPPEP